MSKWNELVSAAGELRRQKEAYEQKIYTFVGWLRSAMIQYLGAPNGNIRLFNPSEGYKERAILAPDAAAERSPQGHWTVGVAVILEPDPTFRITMKFLLGIDMRGDAFAVGFEGGSAAHRIGAGARMDSHEVEALLNPWCREIEDFLTTPMEDRLPHQDAEIAEIGFHAQE